MEAGRRDGRQLVAPRVGELGEPVAEDDDRPLRTGAALGDRLVGGEDDAVGLDEPVRGAVDGVRLWGLGVLGGLGHGGERTGASDDGAGDAGGTVQRWTAWAISS